MSGKKNLRISSQQKEKLVEYMSTNLEFARGQFGGLDGNSNSKEQWQNLSTYLNSLCGSGKTVEQWKKCWADLKSAVKKHMNARRAFMNKTGGGSWNAVPRDLNALEENILQIITNDAVDGDSRTPESGTDNFNFEEPIMEIEILEEETLPTPAKKPKTLIPELAKCSSKYKESLEEARKMTQKVMQKLEKIESQNELILNRLNALEIAFNISSV